jgi:putative ABC transport system permease protein
MINDILYALRSLRKKPLFFSVAVLTLALGIGANTAIFTVVNSVLLRPLPYPDAERLMMVWTYNPRQGFDKDVATYPNFEDWRNASQSFERISGYTGPSFTLTGLGDPTQIRGAAVTWEFFETMAAPPMLGRVFAAADAAPGAGQTAVISHAFWQTRMGSDRGVVGRAIMLNGASYEVIGVMPQTFAHPQDAEVWTPMTPTGVYGPLFTQRGSFWLTVVGRLKPGVTRAAAQSEMDGIASRLERQYQDNAGIGVRLVPLHDEIVGDVRRPLLILLGAVCLVLLIACANVANLLLTRSSARQRELAIRSALGAGRARLLRQMLTESIVLAVIGGTTGVLLAAWSVDLLQSLAPPGLPRLSSIRIDMRVLSYALGAAVVTGLLFGIAPALHAAENSSGEQLKEGGRAGSDGTRGRRIRSVLAVAELAVALVLLIGAGLLVRSIVALNNVDPGFATRDVLALRVELPRLKYNEPAKTVAFFQQLGERLASLPGVQSTGAGTSLLLSRLPQSATIAIDGRPPVDPAQQDIPVPYDAVTPGFFSTLQIPLVRGRMFTEADSAQAQRVALVNEAFVRRFFPNEDPIGKRLMFDNPTRPGARWATIVGVVADTGRGGFGRPVWAETYFPHQQTPDRRMFMFIRTSGDPAALARAAQAQVWSIDRDQAVSSVRTVAETLARSEANRRFVTLLLGIFAAVALVLAAIGVYGVLAYATAQRTHEIGIRMALGADRRSVLRMVLGGGMKLAAAGLTIGIAGAFALTQVLSGLLFGVSARDPLTFVLVPSALGAVALLASWIPARRAVRVEPVVALRGE